MPGNPASYLNTGSDRLTSLLNTPIPGVNSAGFDSLSSSYDTAEQGGISDIAQRGLTTTGATSSMYRGLNTQYQQGASQVVAQGAQEQDKQRLAILNSLLGLGSAGLNVSRAGVGSELENVESGADLLEGLFDVPIKPGGSGGFLSSGITGPGGLFSQLGLGF